ncbi:MAG: hypothetical protein KDB68_06850 [Planctomycetes bacterium]|nr:hypothetical protein [Planctomycetota bacterium]
MYRCLIASICFLLAGCASVERADTTPSAAELEQRLIESGEIERMNAGPPMGWYWLIGTPLGLLSATGKSDPDFRLDGDRIEPIRLNGVDDPEALVEFPSEPDGLEWQSGKHYYMVEYESSGVSYSERARSTSWGAPKLSMDTEDAVLLIQSASYFTDVATVFFTGREFMQDGKKRIAWWRDTEPKQVKTQERVLIRFRYFDNKSLEWSAVERALELSKYADPENRHEAAGRALADDLRISTD